MRRNARGTWGMRPLESVSALFSMVLLLLTACGDAAREERAAGAAGMPAVKCGEVTPAKQEALPFEWVVVRGIPGGFGPAVAEVTARDVIDTLLAPVSVGVDGQATLRVPVHPSFRRAGGDVSIRIYSDAGSCEPMSLTILELPSAPGTMAESVHLLRTALDEIIPVEDVRALAADLSNQPPRLSIFAVPVLWTLPSLERLESMIEADNLSSESPQDAEMLNALASTLELPARMRGLRELILVARELTGDPTLGAVVPPAEAASPHPSPFRFASLTRPTVSAIRASESSCDSDRFNVFDIEEPAKLDNLMRAQHYAERFLAGTEDEEGGSASGTVFGDIGVLMGSLELLGEHGKVATEVWEAFSEIVLNTAEAYRDLLPGDMELTVEATPLEFEEDSEEKGRWTASAVATSNGMRLTREILEKVMSTAFKAGLGDASVGKPLTQQVGGSLPDDVLEETSDAAAKYYGELGSRLAKKADKALTKKATGAIGSLIEALGGEEGPDGFDIPSGCWTLSDMSASDAPDKGIPALVTSHLRGDAFRFTTEEQPRREYEPAQVGVSSLEVRTAEGYRKAIRLADRGLITRDGQIEIAATWAFGGDQAVAVARLEVLPIRIDLNPSLQRVEPGDTVPFVATVSNAVDTRVRWNNSAGEFDEVVDFGEGTHEAQLIAPADVRSYPVRIEVESVARGGTRKDGTPERKAVAYLVLEDPTVDVLGPECVPDGGTAGFAAQILGTTRQDVIWSVRRSKGARGGRIDSDGQFHAPASPGGYEITATWTGNETITGTREIRIGGCASSFVTYGGTLHGSFESQPGNRFGVLYSAADATCRAVVVLTSEEGDNVALSGLFPGRLAPGVYKIGRDQGLESPGVWAAQVWAPCERGVPCTGNGRRPMTRFEGELRIDHVSLDHVSGDFALTGVGQWSEAGTTLSGLFSLPLGGSGSVGGRTVQGIPSDHPCAPESETPND